MKHFEKILIIIIILTINVLSNYIYKRYDMTKSKAFSLSQATKLLIDSLEEPVKIRLFFSKDLPGPSNDIRLYLRDILTEYQTYSKGKVYFEFINPDSEEKFVKEATEVKIAPVSIEIYEKNKMEVRDVYLGAAITYKNKNEIIPIIRDTEGLEFLITNTIKRMWEARPRFVAYFQPMIESDFEYEEQYPIPPNVQVLYQLLSEISIFDRTDLYTLLPPYTDLLIVNGVKDTLHTAQLYVIDQFIMSGKPVMIFQDRYIADIYSTSHLFDNNLLEMLRSYGIYVKPALIMDATNYQVTFQRNQNGQTIPFQFYYPFFPTIKSFSDTLSVHTNLRLIQTYYPSDLHYGRRDAMKQIPMLWTSSKSSERAGFLVDTNFENWLNIDNTTFFTLDSRTIASLFTGPANSYFINEDIELPSYITKTDQARIFVAGTTSLTFNTLLANSPDNAGFMLNMVDYLTHHEEFIFMRNRNITYSPMIPLTNHEKTIIKYLNLILPFIIIILSGLIFYLCFKKHIIKIKKI